MLLTAYGVIALGVSAVTYRFFRREEPDVSRVVLARDAALVGAAWPVTAVGALIAWKAVQRR